MKLRYKILISLTVLCFIAVCGLAIAKASWDSHFLDGYEPSAPLNATIRGEEDLPDYHRIDFAYDGVPGMQVPTLLDLPPNGTAPYPCIIFLHGINQNRKFLDEIAAVYTKAGFAICSTDQYTKGERKLEGKNALRDFFALRTRAGLNVVETRRLVDYLQSRPDIAKDRIYLMGASYGAITGATAAAMEPRIRGAILTYGGGNLDLLFDSESSKSVLGKLHWPIKKLIGYVMAPADPINYVAKISPRPTLFQTGSRDTVVPPASGEALYAAAGEPKKFILYDSDHIGLDRDHVFKVLDDTLAWLKDVDAGRTTVAASSGAHAEPETSGARSSN